VPGQPWTTIVGVVGHIHHDRLDEDGRPQVYWNYRQNTQDRMAIVVRTRTSPETFGPSLAAAVRSVDADQPVYDARTLEAVVDRALAQPRMQTTILSSFAALALAIAGVGVYGVVAFAVGRRRREFAIRLALGAERSGIVGLVLRRGLALCAAGAAVGLAAAAATARAIGSLLYGIPRFDAISFAMATGVLITVGLVACCLPARRAASVDPAAALRVE
jgi:ABC-type antimicrobial peptide transport system permease subunit